MKLTLILSTALLLALPLDAVAGGWSAPSGGLVGQLLVKKAKVSAKECFTVEVALKNVGTEPLTVQTNGPFAADFTVQDAKGAAVQPTVTRRIRAASPQWATIAPGAERRRHLSFSASCDGLQLDPGPRAWKLAPGAYTLRVLYRDAGLLPKGRGKVWSGGLTLPPVAVEVR